MNDKLKSLNLRYKKLQTQLLQSNDLEEIEYLDDRLHDLVLAEYEIRNPNHYKNYKKRLYINR